MVCLSLAGLRLPVAALVSLVAQELPPSSPTRVELVRDVEARSWTAEEEARQVVDHRFVPASWGTVIGHPDDPRPTLVSERGELLLHGPGPFAGFATRLGVDPGARQVERQELDSPAVPVVATSYSGEEDAPLTVLTFALPPEAERPDGAGIIRRGTVLNVATADEKPIRIVLETRAPLVPGEDRTHVTRDGNLFLAFTEPWAELVSDGDRHVFTFPAESRSVAAVVTDGEELDGLDMRWTMIQGYYGRGYWEDLELPYETITVPDPGLQALLTSSVRNLWQVRAREARAFSAGAEAAPAGGVWESAAFLLEARAFLGREEEAREGLELLLDRRSPEGRPAVAGPDAKDHGALLYALARHGQLTGDRDWLQSRWGEVQEAVRAIRDLRARAREDPDAPHAGLLPPGSRWGSMGAPRAEYDDVYWSLVGLQAAAEAAHLLGHGEEATRWEAELGDLLDTFDRAGARTRRGRGDGAYVLPLPVEPAPDFPPERGQESLLRAVYPGQVFAPDHPLVRGTLALLRECGAEGSEGGGGSLAPGARIDFAASHAHALLWAGEGERAADLLYSFANQASPTGAWGAGPSLTGSAGAELVRLVRNLVAMERGDDLHLLAGLPRAWLKPGSITSFEGVPTDFGPLDLVLWVDETLREASLLFATPNRRPPARVVVHLGAWAGEVGAPREASDGWMEVTVQLVD